MEYYDFDQITDITSKINPLLGCVIMTGNNNLYILNTFEIGSAEINVAPWYKKKQTATKFFIKEVVFVDQDGKYKHTSDHDSIWCTSEGAERILEDRDRYLKLRKKLVDIATVSGSPIIYFPVEEHDEEKTRT